MRCFAFIFLLLASPCLAANPTTLPTRKVRIPGTTVDIEMVKIPAGKVELAGLKPDDAARVIEVKSIWVARTETTWDMVDPWRLGTPKPRHPGTAIDAITIPSQKPYADFGFSFEGYPVNGLTYVAATRYCNWLRDQTDLPFRLPTEAEWEYAARCGGPPLADLTAEQLDRIAWTATNSSIKFEHQIPTGWNTFITKSEKAVTHPVGKKPPNAWGLYDTLGNVAEWVRVEQGERPFLKGGHFLSQPDEVNSSKRLYETKEWRRHDPSDPPAKAWFPDAPFANFRVVCEDDPPTTRPTRR